MKRDKKEGGRERDIIISMPSTTILFDITWY